MKMFQLLLTLFLLFFVQESYSGFVAGTLVKVPDGYEPIEILVPGSMVYSLDKQGHVCFSKVKKIISYKCCRAVVFQLQDVEIVTVPFQKYYISNFWQDAKDITIDTKLSSLIGAEISINSIQTCEQEVEFFDIQLEDVHTFCVTRHDIVVHNFPPVFIGIAFSVGGGITFEGIQFGICVIGIWLGTKFLKKSEGQDDLNGPIEVVATCDVGSNEKEEIVFYMQDDNSQGAQAPGKPTEDDGFVPKKKWDGKKVPNPNGPGYGWPDEKGNVWVPSGPNGHGGPH